jgi:hypothetical protein
MLWQPCAPLEGGSHDGDRVTVDGMLAPVVRWPLATLAPSGVGGADKLAEPAWPTLWALMKHTKIS